MKNLIINFIFILVTLIIYKSLGGMNYQLNEIKFLPLLTSFYFIAISLLTSETELFYKVKPSKVIKLFLSFTILNIINFLIVEFIIGKQFFEDFIKLSFEFAFIVTLLFATVKLEKRNPKNLILGSTLKTFFALIILAINHYLIFY